MPNTTHGLNYIAFWMCIYIVFLFFPCITYSYVTTAIFLWRLYRKTKRLIAVIVVNEFYYIILIMLIGILQNNFKKKKIVFL